MCGQPKEFDERETEIREWIATKWEAILTQNRFKGLADILLWDLRTDGGCTATSHAVEEWLDKLQEP